VQTWFTRANGNTAHNNPSSHLFIPGEPPNYPDTAFDYTQTCLQEGFARVGWPATGDLRQSGWESQAQQQYGHMIGPHHHRYLRYFVRVRVGDLFVMPAGHTRYNVHIGIVAPPPPALSRAKDMAYYYHYDVSNGDWFENAHRVNVDWKGQANGSFAVINLSELGGLWRTFFGPVRAGHERLLSEAKRQRLLD